MLPLNNSYNRSPEKTVPQRDPVVVLRARASMLMSAQACDVEHPHPPSAWSAYVSVSSDMETNIGGSNWNQESSSFMNDRL